MDEGNSGGVRPEGGTGQGQAAGGRVEGFSQTVTPGEGVTGVVDFVHDDQGAAIFGPGPVQHGLVGYLGVGQSYPLVAAAGGSVGVFEVGVDGDSHPGGGISPLAFEVVGGGHDGHAVNGAAVEEFLGHGQGEGGFTGAGGCHGHEVAGVFREVELHGFGLPGTEFGGGAPGCSVGVGRRKVLGAFTKEG